MEKQNEDYVTYDVAQLLQQKGYNERTRKNYITEDIPSFSLKEGDFVLGNYSIDGESKCIPAPTLAEAAKWLRDEHKKAICILPYCFHWNYNIYDLKEVDNDCTHKILGSRVNWETYEQALNEGIKESLEML